MRAEFRRLLAPLRRFSRAEILTMLALAVQPLVLILLALVIAAIEYPWILLVWLVQVVVIGIYAGVLLRRRVKSRWQTRHNPQVTGFLSQGFLDDAEQSAELSGNPGAARRTINRLIEKASADELLAFALHTGTRSAIDAVILRATGGALDLRALLAVAALPVAARSRSLGMVDADALVGIARVGAIHDLGSMAAERLLDLAVSRRQQASDAARLRLAELCVTAGRFDDAGDVVDLVQKESWQRRLLLADLVDPHVNTQADDETAWLALMNPSFTATGIEPLALLDAPGVPFDRLAAPAAVPSSATGPRVTVIMTAYRPNDDTIHSVRSIMDQTWREWELLVMDDASGADFDEVFSRIAAMDSRITVVRAEVNAGTYVRRNEALQRATGDFVTMQDSDDWSHPRRLELQVRHLLEHSERPANLCSALRVTSQLLFTQGRGLYLRLSEPSLMFRRELVVGRIGYFDSTRKSADSEYRVRIGAEFKQEVPHLTTRGPLMLMRFDSASLSGSDMADGWTHPARVAYRSSYSNWIDRTVGRGETPRLPFPLESRPYHAPSRIVDGDRDRGEVDVLLVLDARQGGTLDRQGSRDPVRPLGREGSGATRRPHARSRLPARLPGEEVVLHLSSRPRRRSRGRVHLPRRADPRRERRGLGSRSLAGGTGEHRGDRECGRARHRFRWGGRLRHRGLRGASSANSSSASRRVASRASGFKTLTQGVEA